MLKEREVKVNIYRDESQSNLFRSGGKIRRPKSVQHRLHPTNSSTRLSVVKVPIKVDPEWQPPTPPTTNTFNFQFQPQNGYDACSFESPPPTPLPPETPAVSCDGGKPWTFIRKETTAAAPAAAPVVAQSDGDFALEALKLHNKVRVRHGAPELTLDDGLCRFAQRWADQLAEAGRFEHCPDNPYGENLYAQWATSTKSVCPADRAVDSWYEEGASYNYSREPTSMSVGHFTQLVWKNTRRMGIARAKTKDGKRTMIVAHYDPPGNYIGQYVQNVRPPQAAPPAPAAK